MIGSVVYLLILNLIYFYSLGALSLALIRTYALSLGCHSPCKIDIPFPAMLYLLADGISDIPTYPTDPFITFGISKSVARLSPSTHILPISRCRAFRIVIEQVGYQATTIPTDPFAILEPQNPGIDKFYVVWKRRSTDLKAL